MFDVRIHKRVGKGVGWSSRDVVLIRDFQLPFAPFIGLAVHGVLSDLIEIKEVSFDILSGRFDAWEECDETRYHEMLAQRRNEVGSNDPPLTPYKEMIEGYLESGWGIEDRDKIADITEEGIVYKSEVKKK